MKTASELVAGAKARIREIDVNAAETAIAGADLLIDVREADEFAASHMGGARNIPLNTLEEKLPLSVKNKALPLVLVCDTGGRANRALAVAKKLGYEQAQVLGGGLKSWKEANLPIEKA